MLGHFLLVAHGCPPPVAREESPVFGRDCPAIYGDDYETPLRPIFAATAYGLVVDPYSYLPMSKAAPVS